MRITCFNNISNKGLSLLTEAGATIEKSLSLADAIILRSHNLHAETIPSSVRAIARAGAGVNNVPVDWASEHGIPVFNAPGANANAVKELVLAAMLMTARHLGKANQYVRGLTLSTKEALNEELEQGKKRFAGFELPGRTLGVVGLGAIGVLVANAAVSLGMRVVGFDPGITVKRAWQLSSHVEQASDFHSLLKQADFVTCHVPLSPATKYLFNADSLSLLKPEAILLNFARAELVDEEVLIDRLASDKLRAYATDFPSNSLLKLENVLAFPHLGASTQEAEENCAVMVAQQLLAFLRDGTIENAVNFPNAYMPRSGKGRLLVANENVPNMLGQITTLLAENKINIVNMLNHSRERLAYNMLDLDEPIDEGLLAKLREIEGVLSAYYLK